MARKTHGARPGSLRFTKDYQPLARNIVARRGAYWKSIPLAAFSVPVRQWLASIPPNQWWQTLDDPDDLDLIRTHLLIAQVITPRDAEFNTWQVRNSCRHLIHDARAWVKLHAALAYHAPQERAMLAPEAEGLYQVNIARDLHSMAFPHVPDVFPGCPAAYVEIRRKLSEAR